MPATGDPAAFGDEVTAARRELGHLLARLRHGAGLSQRQLARTLGYSAAVVALAEKGRPAAAEGFWVSADQVLGADGQLCAGYHKLRDMQQAARESERSRQIAVRLERISGSASDRLRDIAGHDGARGATATAIGMCPSCHQPVMLVTVLTAPGETDSGSPTARLAGQARALRSYPRIEALA